MIRILLPVLLLAAASACTTRSPAPSPLSAKVTDGAEPTVVFIHGNGASAAAWDSVAPAVADSGVATLVYDRAGLGESPLFELPYSVMDEGEALRTLLDEKGIAGPIVLVAHSYGGLIAAQLAADPRTRGVVLVDAMIPAEMTEASVEATLAAYRPRYDAVRAQAPALAKAVIPVVEAFPQTREAVAGLSYPAGLPVYDLRAADAEELTPAIEAATEAAHAAFVAADPARELLIVEDSGHNVMQDRPGAVRTAITGMVATVQSSE